jgi:hypothetical protein
MNHPMNDEHRISWTTAGVLRHAAVLGDIEPVDVYAGPADMHIRVCDQLVAEGLMRLVGHATYAITDKGREWLVWGARGF